MRRIVLTMTLLMSGWTRAGSLQAGVYNLDPPTQYPRDYIVTHAPQPLKPLAAYLLELRAIPDSQLNLKQAPARGSLREVYLKQFAKLDLKRKERQLSVGDRINLSSCLIRLGRYAKAQELLEESLRQAPPGHTFRFLLLLNLAAACQEDDSLLQRGIELQRQALQSWPALLPGWKAAEWRWYRHVEQYTLELMQLRNRESIRRGGRPAREQLAPDPLFPREERDLSKKVQFIGDSGEYEAGGIAWKQSEQLPADADCVVLQLLLWRPHDSRLLWQYGELLNARGRVDGAYYILKDIVRDNDQWRNRELERHVRVLSDARAPYRELFADSAGSGEDRRKQALLLWLLAPRGTLLPPVIGAAANEIGGVAASMDVTDLSGAREPLETAGAPGKDTPRSGAILPDWRQLTVGFLTGVVVALLGVFQWQQWRRHRRAVPTLPSRTAEHFAPK